MAQRYLVTGCAGFIGAVVCRELVKGGHLVLGVDNLNDAYDPRLKQWRLKELQALGAAFEFAAADITGLAALESLFRRHGGASQAPYTAVINLAARAGVHPSVTDPWVYLQTNAHGTLNLLELSRRFGVRKFVLASTSSLYGMHNPLPYREDADTSRPLSPYAASKKAAEALAYTYHHLHGLDVTVLRYFTVYGPAGRPDMSVFRFIRRIAEGEPIVVFGDGMQERDFTYVDDIAQGTLAALRPLGYEVINLGSDRPMRLLTLIEGIAEMVGREPILEHRPFHRADVPATWADISKARRLLGWSPQTPLQEGLRRAVAWYRDHRELALPIELGDR